MLRAVLVKGRSVYFTGGAGTGKSFVIREIQRLCPREYCYTTGMTSNAGRLIGGTTLHEFAGFGFHANDPYELAEMVRRNAVSLVCISIIILKVS